MSDRYVGIDLGTSSVKSVLIDAEQRIVGSASASLSVSRPRAGWSEQDPEDWWLAAAKTLDTLATMHTADMSAVAGIGLSGQMHGATLLDSAGEVLRPAMLWNDGRAYKECKALEHAADFRGIGGNLVMPGFTAPKVAWVREHEPRVFERTARVLLPKDYLRWRLTGEYVSDMSDAAGTLWLDVAARDWSDSLLAATGLDRSHMPGLVEGSQVSGQLLKELAVRWGMQAPSVVAGGGGDNAAAACGVGVLAPGTAFASIGTSGVLFVANDRFSPNTAGAVHAFCHAAPGVWHQMGVILSAADSLEWLASVVGAPAAELVAELEREPGKPANVFFLPYLSGERTPYNDAAARGAFVGISRADDRRSLVRAVLEGVAYAFRDCLGALEDAGTNVDRAFAIGGGARSRLWMQMLATVIDRPLDLPKDGDYGAAFGAARLGLCAAHGADPIEVCTRPEVEAVIEPDPSLVGHYRAGYERYRSLYPAIKENSALE